MIKSIDLSKNFRKKFKKLVESRPKFIIRINERVDLFLEDRESKILNDHNLKGDLEGVGSFSITGDLRILYEELEDRFVFLDIGTHSQVYS